MTKIRKKISAVLLAVAMAVAVMFVPMLGTQTAHAGETLSGGVYKASEWPSSADNIGFSGDTMIMVDAELNLGTIDTGEYDLTIVGDGTHTLTLEGTGTLINTKRLSIWGASIEATQRYKEYDGNIFSAYGLTCLDSTITIDDQGRCDGIYVNGDANISDSTIKTRTYGDGLDIYGMLAITSSELELYVTSGESCIYTDNVTLSDDIYIKSPAKGKFAFQEEEYYYYLANADGESAKKAVISKKRLSDDICTVSNVYTQAYTGKAVKPDVTVKWDGKTLKNGTDYTLSYKNNVNAGTATITITGKGNYTGTKTLNFKIKGKIVFDDVKEGHVFYNPIYWAAANEITYGVAGTKNFNPNGIVTRGQVVAFLYRMDGNPKTTGFKNKFKDVTSKSTFYNPILWGGKTQVVAGYPDGTFREKVTCTRGQIVAFLWRMAGKPEPKTKQSSFKDINTNNTFYKAILWASEKGVTVGYNDGRFRSGGDCTRGQMVAFLQRFAKQYPSKVKI